MFCLVWRLHFCRVMVRRDLYMAVDGKISLEDTASLMDVRDLHRLLEISQLLSATLDLQALLDMVISVAAELTHMSHASLLLLDGQMETLRFVATSNEPGLVGLTVPMDESLAGWAIVHKRPLVVQDVDDDQRHYAQIDRFTKVETNALIAVPLMNRERVIGVLEALNKVDGGACTPQDVMLLEVLASQAAVAIENARLFQQSDEIAEVMHELKTPLLAFTAAIDLLEHPNLPGEKQSEILQTMRGEAARLTEMVQGFLELSRLDSGRVRLAWQPIDLVALAEDVVRIQRPQAAERGVTIWVSCAEERLPRPHGDYDRLKQVLLNLVSNAIKYNVPDGQVEIRLYQPGVDEVAVVVRDTGVGIKAENLGRLFDKFYRVPGSEGYTEGTGLGLSIARRIVEAHNGRVEVSSERGKGTTFRCVLKLADVA